MLIVFIFLSLLIGVPYMLTDQQEFKHSDNHIQMEIMEIENISLVLPYVKDTYNKIHKNIMVNNRPGNSTVYIPPNGELTFICPQGVICEIDKNVQGMTDEIIKESIDKGNMFQDEIGKKVLEQFKLITSQPKKAELERIRQGSYNLLGLKYNTYVANHTFWRGEGRCVEMVAYAYIDIFRKNWNQNKCIDMAHVEIVIKEYKHSFLLVGQLPPVINNLSLMNSDNLLLFDPWESTIDFVSNVFKSKIPLYTTKYIRDIRIVWEFKCSVFEDLKNFDSKYGSQLYAFFIGEIDEILS